MKNTIVIFVLILSLIGCKNKSEEAKETSTQIMESNEPTGLLEVGCYAYNANKSAIKFEIMDIKDDIIKGNLKYRLAEKDANIGTFEGVLIDDILLGDYTFQSEGLTSTREVIFKIINGQLIEGYGNMDEEGTHFVNTDHVTFTSTMPLTKMNCIN